jgi:hypothetical protein
MDTPIFSKNYQCKCCGKRKEKRHRQRGTFVRPFQPNLPIVVVPLHLRTNRGDMDKPILSDTYVPEAGVVKKLSLAGLPKLSRLRYS